MEKASKTQLAVMAAGGETVKLSLELLESTARQFERDAEVTQERPSGWESLKRMLDRVSPGYDA